MPMGELPSEGAPAPEDGTRMARKGRRLAASSDGGGIGFSLGTHATVKTASLDL